MAAVGILGFHMMPCPSVAQIKLSGSPGLSAVSALGRVREKPSGKLMRWKSTIGIFFRYPGQLLLSVESWAASLKQCWELTL